ncbi:MAG TPA: DUF4167 domain-containing protein [Croceibacterium sp.]
MNQNRNNNRRRGRGNNRGGQGGGGNQGNRIDSRARGNAPQMLEKYRKLAHDASLNGDRVQTEYYLQFADHYFRVIADMRTQKDDQRPRRDERENAYDDHDDFDDFDDIGRGRPHQQQPRREDADEVPSDEGERGSEGEEPSVAEPADNPFTRDTRGRGTRSRGRRPANDASDASDAVGGEREAARSDNEAGFDPGLLPPSIAREDEAPRRAPRGRRRARPDEDGEEALEAVN